MKIRADLLVLSLLLASAVAAQPPSGVLGPASVTPASVRNLRGAIRGGAAHGVLAAMDVAGTPRPLHVQGRLSAPSAEPHAAAARRFLDENRALIQVRGDGNDFALERADADELGYSHARFAHTYRGLDVWPESVVVHLKGDGSVYCVNGTLTDVSLPDVAFAVGQAEAESVALGGRPSPGDVRPSSRLVVYSFRVARPVLAWQVVLSSPSDPSYVWTVFVDAKTGLEVNSIDGVRTGNATTSTAYVNNNLVTGQQVTVNTWRDDDGRVYLVDASKPMFTGTPDLSTFLGLIAVFETNHTDTSAQGKTYIGYDTDGDNVFAGSDEVLMEGMTSYNIGRVYDYFWSAHNRNSIDDKGMGVKVFVNYRKDPAQGFDNAFWNGQVIVLGDGGTITHNWAGSLDLTAHEYTHGVTDYTCKLIYQFEQGALNESMSDVFGASVDNDDWLIGETIINTQYAQALRSMSDPHNDQPQGSNFWQPAHMSEFANLSASQDNGGVHVNSGIPNRAFYLAATAISRDKAERVWYRAMQSYLTANSDFAAARRAMEQSATDLFGQGSAELAAVQKAFTDVGIGSTPTPTGENNLYFPMATNFDYFNRSYTTQIWVTNTTDTPANLTLNAYDIYGAVTDSFDYTLNSRRLGSYDVGAGTALVKVASDQRLVGICNNVSSNGDSWIATTPSETAYNGVYIPHITGRETPEWYTLCSVANVVDTPNSVVYVDNAGWGATFPISGVNQSIFFDFWPDLYQPIHGAMPDVRDKGGLWALFANYDLQQGKVLNPDIASAEVFGMDNGMAAGLTLDAESGRTLLFGHIANPDVGWWTGIALVNLEADPDPNDSVTTQPIQVTAFAADGTVKKQTICRIPYLGKVAQMAHGWTEGGQRVLPDGTAWATVSYMSEGNYLTGYELFGRSLSGSGDYLAGLESARYVSTKILFPWVPSGEWDTPDNTNWTGMVVINPNGSPTGLKYRLYDWSGALLKTVETSLGANKKDVRFAHEIFGMTDFLGWVEVESTQYVAGFCIFGYADERSTAGVSAFLAK